jgi:hypothetical protein
MVTVKRKDGKSVTLLNPREKMAKAKAEMKSGIRITNDGVAKTDENGNLLRVDEKGMSYRAGYRQARIDSAKAHEHNRIKNAKQGY